MRSERSESEIKPLQTSGIGVCEAKCHRREFYTEYGLSKLCRPQHPLTLSVLHHRDEAAGPRLGLRFHRAPHEGKYVAQDVSESRDRDVVTY